MCDIAETSTETSTKEARATVTPREVDAGTGDRVSRRAGRPSTPVLNRGMISDAALAIVTDEGQSALTMKRLAGRLGVSVSALYNHIANKAELMLAVQDAVMSRVDASAFDAVVAEAGAADGSGTHPAARPAGLLADALRAWSRSYRKVFADYPSLVPLIATMPVSGAPATRRMYDAVAAGLLAVGVPSPQVVPVIVAFESFLYGSAMDVRAPAGIFGSRPGEQDAPSFRSVVASFTGQVDAGEDAAGPNPYADQPFEWGLDALVARTLALLG